MAAESYWRYADAQRQQQQAAMAAAVGMAPAAAAAPQTVAMAPPAAAPPLKRACPDYADVPGASDMTGYYPREDERASYRALRDTEALGVSYDRYLRNGMPPVGATETTRPVGVVGGMAGYPVDDRRMMGVVGVDSTNMGYAARPEPPLPPDASNTLYVEGLPSNCTRREVSHIFRQADH